jgi:hypothetical protein
VDQIEAYLSAEVPERAEGIKRESNARETDRARRREAIIVID